MNLLESIKMAVSILSAYRLRTGLTMLGIIIGSSSVIATIGIGQGTQKLVTEQFEKLGPNLLFVVPGSEKSRRTEFNLPKTLVLEDAQAIAQEVPSILQVAPQLETTQVMTYGSQNTRDLLIGTTPEFLKVRNFQLSQGQFISEVDLQRNNRVVVLGSEIADKLFGQQNPIGEFIRLKNLSFEVIGVLRSKGSILGNNQDEMAIIPLTTMVYQMLGKTSPYGIEVKVISVTAKDKASMRAAKFQLENLLRLRHKIITDDDFEVQTQSDIVQMIVTLSTGLTAMLALIAGISLLVGGIGVMNIMLVSVTERTQEIGLRKALGATEKDILAQFLIEAMIVSIAGGVIGSLMGVSAIFLIGIISPLSPGISPLAIVISVGFSAAIGLCFGVFPAQKAARLEPIVALRSS